MSPPAPPVYRQGFSDLVQRAFRVKQSAVMVSRHLIHWPWRTLGGVLGIAMSVAILVSSLWIFGAMEWMVDFSFHQSDRQDASISFLSPRPLGALFAVEHLPGVLKAEPYRAVPVKLRFGQIERRVAIDGRPSDADLSRVLDVNQRIVPMPEAGVVLSKPLADILGAHVGDMLEAELLDGDRRTLAVPVSATVDGYLGLSAYMELGALNRLLREGAMISGVSFAIDPLEKNRLFAALKATPSESFISLQQVAMQRFRATLAQNITVQITIFVAFAGTIGLGRAFDREREGDTMRALLLSPAPRLAIFLGKAIGIAAMVFAVAIVVVPLLTLFLGADLLAAPALLALVLLLGAIGFAIVGTVFAATQTALSITSKGPSSS